MLPYHSLVSSLYVVSFIHQFIYLSICLSIYPFVNLFIYLPIYSSICLSIHPFVYLFIHLSISIYTYLSICLSIHPFVYLFIHLFAVSILLIQCVNYKETVYRLLYLPVVHCLLYHPSPLSFNCKSISLTFQLFQGLPHYIRRLTRHFSQSGLGGCGL